METKSTARDYVIAATTAIALLSPVIAMFLYAVINRY